MFFWFDFVVFIRLSIKILCVILVLCEVFINDVLFLANCFGIFILCVIFGGFLHRRMGHGFRFFLPPFRYYPLFSKFSYTSFLFLHLTISVDVIHHD